MSWGIEGVQMLRGDLFFLSHLVVGTLEAISMMFCNLGGDGVHSLCRVDSVVQYTADSIFKA